MTLRTVVAGALLLAALAGIVLLDAGAADGSRIARHDKVRVLDGRWEGNLGAVLSASRGRYRVRLGGGAVGRFRSARLERLPLAKGDAVRVLSGPIRGRRGRITRVPRGRRVLVDLRRGPVRRFARTRLGYIAPSRRVSAVPFARPSCRPGATRVTTAGQVRAEVAAGRDVCVRANVGDVDLSRLRQGETVHVGTAGGAMGHVMLVESERITLRARFRSAEIRGSRFITIESSIVGGSRGRRVLDTLIYAPCCTDDLTVRASDIGWTTADDSGNSGYGIRIHGGEGPDGSDRVTVERNRIHHVGGDAIQGLGNGRDVLIDRNEIAYVAAPPGSGEHADDLQVIDNGPNLRVTNNFLHDNGMLDAGVKAPSESGPYIHAGDDDPMLFANNLVRDEWNFMVVGDLGTGGCARSNLRLRRNTFANNALAYDGRPDFVWRLCEGQNNVYEQNLVVGTFGFERPLAASGTASRRNLAGRYRLDRRGNCTSAACNPRGGPPIGYRRPAGAPW